MYKKIVSNLPVTSRYKFIRSQIFFPVRVQLNEKLCEICVK